MTVHYLSRPHAPKLAYVRSEGAGPPVVFLGGFKSDMNGTKATWLEQQAKARGQAFVRFDYSGHGQSEGDFKSGTIGSWRRDALDVLAHTVKEPAVLVGSSMGGWIGLSIVSQYPDKIRGFVGIAAAPDFTDTVYAKFTDEQKQRFDRDGFLEEPNQYSPDPYIFTKELLDDGRSHFLLNKAHSVKAPMHLIQGKMDPDVDWHMPERIRTAFPEAQIKTTWIDDGDHRLSRPVDLQMIDDAICALSGL